MSWDSYIDNVIANSGGSCDKVCIIGFDGSCWTNSSAPNALVLQGNEGVTIGNSFKSKDFTHFTTNGIHIAGTKYRFLRAEEGVVFGKLKDQGSITMQATKQAVLIAHCPEGKQHGNLNKAVGTVADYLIGVGY